MWTTRLHVLQGSPRRDPARLLAATLAVVLAFAGAARAQTGDQPKSTDFALVLRSCTHETKDFCPSDQPGGPSGRDAATCLKFHKADLSLSCRKAVSAVTQ